MPVQPEHPAITVICYGATLNAIPTLRAEGVVVRYHVGPYPGLRAPGAVAQLMTSYGITQRQADQLVDMASACFTVLALDRIEVDKARR